MCREDPRWKTVEARRDGVSAVLVLWAREGEMTSGARLRTEIRMDKKREYWEHV